MKYYFSASAKAAIKLDGIYRGIIGGDLTFFTETSKTFFVEILPLSPSFADARFILDEKIADNPPENAVITDLDGGFLIRCEFLPFFNGNFTILDQKKFSDAVITVFNENGLKVSIETPSGAFADRLNCYENTSSILRFSEKNRDYAAIIAGDGKKHIIVYSLNGTIKRVFETEADSCSADGGFYTEKSYEDIAKHKVKTQYGYTSDEFTVISREVSTDKSFNPYLLPQKILPFAFCEEFMLGGDCTPFITEKMKNNLGKLAAYTKNYVGVMPPPAFKNTDGVGLIYKIKPNFFRVEYFTFIFSGGKIDNVKKL